MARFVRDLLARPHARAARRGSTPSARPTRPRPAASPLGRPTLEALEPRVLLSISLQQPIDDVFINRDDLSPVVIDLDTAIDDPDASGLIAGWQTNLISDQTDGRFYLDLFEDITPATVQNFINYVDDGDYFTERGSENDAVFFHRMIQNFVLQGGGFRYDYVNQEANEVPADEAIQNEFANHAKLTGSNATITADSGTLQLPADTDLSDIQPGDRIRLIGESYGLSISGTSTDFFKITGVDDATDTLTISTSETESVAPTSGGTNVEWFITSDVNTAGTIAMAKLGTGPDTATSQWFLNLGNNSANLDVQNGGFTTFGKVIDFDSLVLFDLINDLETFDLGGQVFSDVPVQNPGTENQRFLQVVDIAFFNEKTFEIENSNPDLVTVSVDENHQLSVTPTPGVRGTSTITVTATGYDGTEVVTTFDVDIPLPPPSLDLDDNGSVNAFSDGLLIIRYMLGFTGDNLTRGLLSANSQQTDPDTIINFIEQELAMVDADGSGGDLGVFTDGLLIIRHIIGFQGSALTAGVLGDGATRDAAQITSFLNAYDTADLAITQLQLDPASDTAPQGDNATTEETITVTGVTRPGATITLEGSQLQATADSEGHFQIDNIPLDLGENTLTFQSTLQDLAVDRQIVITRNAVTASSIEPEFFDGATLVPVSETSSEPAPAAPEPAVAEAFPAKTDPELESLDDTAL